uniref:Uncharacterized protein n=1 Tax=Tetraselmis chuii TaxID=63592 RepID=A0A7S1SWC0_9CHLO
MADWNKQDQSKWLDSMYRDPNRENPPLPHSFIEDVEARLDEIEGSFVHLTKVLWEHDYSAADLTSSRILIQTRAMKAFADTHLSQARQKLRCCELVHVVPKKTPATLLYALCVLLALGAFLLISTVSSFSQQAKHPILSPGERPSRFY